MFDKTLFCIKTLGEVLCLLLERLIDTFYAKVHLYTYQPSDTPKTVIVVGGSYAGYARAEHLATSLPSGWRVQMIEKNSHFSHTWLFPRISVIDRHHELAFIPYPEKPSLAPDGIFEHVGARVTSIRDDSVLLEDQQQLGFDYIVLATGLRGRYPPGIDDLGKAESLQYLKNIQQNVKQAQSIIIAGGGPVGIEIALDIKSEFPDEDVTIVHSRNQLAHKYDAGVHQRCMEALNKMDIRVVLGERVMKEADTQIRLGNNDVLKADHVIMCTGTHLDENLITSIDTKHKLNNKLLKVNEYLQVVDPGAPHIFAVGDIADTGTKKTGRAAGYQGLVAAKNIVRRLRGSSMRPYRPGMLEGFLDLSLGLKSHLIHIGGSSGTNFQFASRTKDETLHARQLWKMLRQTSPSAKF